MSSNTNTVQITIQAEDKSSPELRKIKQNLDALDKINAFKNLKKQKFEISPVPFFDLYKND